MLPYILLLETQITIGVREVRVGLDLGHARSDCRPVVHLQMLY